MSTAGYILIVCLGLSITASIFTIAAAALSSRISRLEEDAREEIMTDPIEPVMTSGKKVTLS